VWQNGGTDSVRLSTHQLRLHRERLKRAGLLLQCEVRGRTYTTVMRAPISPIQQREYEDLYSTLCLKGGTTAAHQIFGALGGQMEGPQVALPRDTITALVLETADLKTIGLWTALAGQETHYNWENVTKIATVLNLSRPCVRKHLTQLEDLGLVARNSKVELNVNMLINKNLNA
jgi:DNA-binding transcriptional ArsR family regulator